ncbi:PTS mannose/fructose/sorbose/N-acetylgalactosamine transporter subunit IIC [Holdemania massiliensis]|uniref:PTS sorbose transporter subunit IIC n=1 Tax=Holdemania massiliensis TaxID=1468449 RepID=A0A6N7S2H5_9FIRM|nr:PTS sugar transporter subunit IIC [Holdemania massiliensis]MSA72677.1 PTS sorbose transporter subunit IIC [Holdemania massiliensis]MSA88067.1 PTS sorbose transporter subunit IIC [Holdemania massiliensis]MSB79762.1 PTS sorbose transporter subunit IIC [Holdemania massiliensis]MSC34683.1 PTS sorbose transporter subunit IIC [Holdemania massiliensis]MSC41072.1 PTS sorbose transporter subunit IIC [Holdemania massiliensis]
MSGGLSIIQILLITAWAFWSIIDSLSWNIGFNNCILACLFTGIVVGDMRYGLVVGGTLQMTQLGAGTYGGASIPNITSSGMIATALGAASGADPIAMASSIGIALAALFTQLDILARFSNTAFQHIADKYVEEDNTKGIALMNTLGIIPWGLSRGLPVLLLLVAGQGVVDTLIKIIPAFIMNGFKFAGGLLPVVGFAILMRYLPVLKKPQFIILGFVLAAYINMPILGIALIGSAAALITYQNATAKLAAGAAQGGDDDYDE